MAARESTGTGSTEEMPANSVGMPGFIEQRRKRPQPGHPNKARTYSYCISRELISRSGAHIACQRGPCEHPWAIWLDMPCPPIMRNWKSAGDCQNGPAG